MTRYRVDIAVDGSMFVPPLEAAELERLIKRAIMQSRTHRLSTQHADTFIGGIVWVNAMELLIPGPDGRVPDGQPL